MLKTSTQILYGVDGIKQAYELTLKDSKLDIVCLSNDYASILGTYFDSDYGPRLFKSGIITREILPDTKCNRDDATKKDQRKNQVKFIKLIKKSESDFILTNCKLILVSYNKKMPYALIIEDLDLITNLENQFENLWQGL